MHGGAQARRSDTRAWRFVGAIGVSACLVLAGCGDDDDASSGATTTRAETGATTTAPSGSASTTSPGGSATSVSFDPAENEASAPGVTEDTIKIGLVSSLTGVASSTFKDTVKAAEARIALENEKGGVYGRQIELVAKDDQSSPQAILASVQSLVENDQVFAVVSASSFMFGGYRYLTDQGVPVTGSAFDGPEWGDPAVRNMFSYSPTTYTNFGSGFQNYTTLANLLKEAGVTKLASLAYGNSPSSSNSAEALLTAAEKVGIEECYDNRSVPFGGVDFTAAVLDIERAGCDGVVGSFVSASNVALASALRNAGLDDIKQYYYTAYDQAVLENSQAREALQGVYATRVVAPTEAGETMVTAIGEADPAFAGKIPNFGQVTAYIGTDLMIRGLWEAGQNPTRESFIENLHKVTDYDGDGLLVSPMRFDLVGEIPMENCAYYTQLQGDEYVPFPSDGEPVCGERIDVPA